MGLILRPACKLYCASQVSSRGIIYKSGTFATAFQTKRVRCFSNAASSRWDDRPVIYTGPLTRTFRRLKIFSLSSLALSACLTPFMFIIEAPLPLNARIALIGSALLASGMSTGLISWAGASYVNTIRRTGERSIELETSDLWLRPVRTAVLNSANLGASRRPFASWELPDEVDGADAKEWEVRELARTVDAKGRLRGTWITEYKKDPAGRVRGTCRGRGAVLRHFNVVEELVDNSER